MLGRTVGVAILLAVTAAAAEWGAVLASYAVPGGGVNKFANGLAHDGTHLWCAEGRDDRIYRMDPATGSVSASFAAPSAVAFGLAYGAGYLWYVDGNSKWYYKMEPATGSVAASFYKGVYKPYGLAHDGLYLWHSCSLLGPGSTAILKMTETGSTVLSYSYNLGGTPHDLGYQAEGAYLWASSFGGIATYVYKFVAADGSFARSFPQPAYFTAGIAYDDARVYVASNQTEWIYVVDARDDAEVAPASLGRVKSLFR
jgi:glutamine cyclotransferase